MPIDASIYQNLKPAEMPSYLDSATKASTLSSLGMQQARMSQEMDQAKVQAHLQKASVFGNTLEGLAGLSEQERAAAWPKVHAEQVRAGIISPEQAPSEYDPGFYRQSLMRYRQTAPAIEDQLKKAQITKLQAEAHRKENTDPLAQFDQRLALKDKYDQAKDDRELRRYSNVQGWSLAEGATPTKDDAKKFKDSVTAAEGMKKSLTRLEGLTATHGTKIWPDEVHGEMTRLARDVQLQAKELYNLGVLNGPDLDLLNQIVSSPTSIKEAINPEGKARALGGLRQFGEMMRNRVESQAGVLGFARKDALASADAPETKNAKGGPSLGIPEAHAGQPSVKPGTVEDGYVYMGGDPSNPKSWKKAR